MAFFETKFDSHKQEWETPSDFFNRLNCEFHFDIDLAADAKNTKCPTFYTSKDNALRLPWHGTCWLNPPYGKRQHKLSDWVQKAFEETQSRPLVRLTSCTVVMLIPARTNTKWWHNYCMKAAEIRFVNGRPKFGDAKYGLPQPLALIVFRVHNGPTILSSFSA